MTPPAAPPPPLRAARAGMLIHADGTCLEDAAVAWRGDEIVAAGPWRAVRRVIGDAPCDGGRDAVLIPGLVNAHQHAHGLTSLAGGVADQPLEGWLADGLGLPVPGDRVSVLLAAARMIRSGTTTAVHLHACRRPADPARLEARLLAYRESGMSVALASGFKSQRRFALVEDEAFLAGLDASLRSAVEAAFGPAPSLDHMPAADWADALRRLAAGMEDGDDGIRLLAGPPGPHWCRRDDLEAVAATMRALGIGAHVHAAESPLQARLDAVTGAPSGPALLEQAGLLGPATSLIHLVRPRPGDLELMARTGTAVVTCPGSNLRLRHGTAPVPRFLEAGLEVALGTDSVGLGDRDDMFAEARLLLALHGAPAEGLALDVARAWQAVTTAGARVAGMPRAGRLEPGARADLVLLDATGIREPGDEWLGDPAAVVLGRARPEDVRLVVARGRDLLRDGRIVTFDEEAVRAEAAEDVARARRDGGSRAELARRLAAAVRSAHAGRLGAPS